MFALAHHHDGIWNSSLSSVLWQRSAGFEPTYLGIWSVSWPHLSWPSVVLLGWWGDGVMGSWGHGVYHFIGIIQMSFDIQLPFFRPTPERQWLVPARDPCSSCPVAIGLSDSSFGGWSWSLWGLCGAPPAALIADGSDSAPWHARCLSHCFVCLSSFLTLRSHSFFGESLQPMTLLERFNPNHSNKYYSNSWLSSLSLMTRVYLTYRLDCDWLTLETARAPVIKECTDPF